MSELNDEKLAELIAIYDEDAELVAFLRELQERRASALPRCGPQRKAALHAIKSPPPVFPNDCCDKLDDCCCWGPALDLKKDQP